MEEHLLGVDPWMKEAQEASNIIEDLENKWRSSMDAASADQSKLVEVGIKLDRLESLLHNPPSKPILREREFELRWKMLSDFRLRTRALADILYQSSSSKRPVEESVDASEFSRSIESHEQAHMKHSFFRHDQEEVLQHLVTDDASRYQAQENHSGTVSLVERACWTVFIIVGAALLLFVLIFICSAI
ncbi:hypothetical protein LINPERPRIM_LOCUS18995 [Linum perenne]